MAWRDSFAIPRHIRESRRAIAESIEDDYLLEVEKKANHLKRRGTSGFVHCDAQGARIPYQAALARQEERDDDYDDDETDDEEVEKRVEDNNNQFGLLARTPVDTNLPTVDLFACEFNPGSESVFRTIKNPLAPASPAAPRLRKTGSLVSFLRVFQSEDKKTAARDHQTETEEEKRDDDDDEEKPKHVEYSAKLKGRDDDDDEESVSAQTVDDRPSTARADIGDESEPAVPPSRRVSARRKVERALVKSISIGKLALKKAADQLAST